MFDVADQILYRRCVTVNGQFMVICISIVHEMGNYRKLFNVFERKNYKYKFNKIVIIVFYNNTFWKHIFVVKLLPYAIFEELSKNLYDIKDNIISLRYQHLISLFLDV